MSFSTYPSKVIHTLKGHQGPVQVVRYNKDGVYCVSGGNDKSIRLWNAAKGTLIKTYNGHGWELSDLDLPKDNSKIASCGGDRSVFIWDVATGKVIRKLGGPQGHNSRINCVKFNEDAGVVLSGSYDKNVKIWDCRSNSFDPIQTLDHAKDSISSLFVTQTEIISASIDGSVRIYDLRNGSVSTDTIGPSVTCIALSNDKNCLLLSCLDNHLRLIDKASGDLLNSYKGHKNSNYKVESCFSNDDAHIYSGSEDGNIFIYDLVEARVLAKIPGHSSCVYSIAMNPKQEGFISSSTDGTIKVWQ